MGQADCSFIPRGGEKAKIHRPDGGTLTFRINANLIRKELGK